MQLTRQQLPTRPATSEDVIDILRADYRFRAAVDPEVDDGEVLERATTLADWRITCDLVASRRLGPLFEMLFDLKLAPSEIERAMQPEDKRSLGDLADWLAPRVALPRVEAFSIAGTKDHGVGAFVALRSLLARAGISVREIRPSTMLSALGREHLVALTAAAMKLAPAALPDPIIEPHPASRAVGASALGGIGFTLLGAIAGVPVITSLGLGTLVLSLVGMGYVARKPPHSVSFGPDVRTVGDLARVIADHQLRAS